MIANTIHNFGGGRLGNQLFQCGLLFSIQNKTGQPFYLTRGNGNSQQFWNCFDVDHIPSTGEHLIRKNYGCPYEFYSEIYDQKLGTIYDGYFQNLSYYTDCKNKYIDFLKFKSEHKEYAIQRIEQLKKYNVPIVSVHIRRGDYLIAEHTWGNLTKSNYYNDIFNKLGSENVYLIFSDDLQWCRENLKNINLKNIEFIDTDEYKCLCMMSMCDINIIGNSTFSWWGAFLNKNSIVYAPDKWTGILDKSTCKFQQNYIFSDWNKIEVIWII
jgi:hypothetical protein